MKPLSLLMGLTGLMGLVAFLGLGSPAPAAAAIDRSQPPKAGPFPDVRLPKAASETLPNGLRVFVLRDDRQPTVTFRLLVKSGSTRDGDKPGRAALAASLLNKGTPDLSAEAFAQKTDFLGVTVEAAAGADATSIVAAGLTRYGPELLSFLRDAALRPAFLQGEIDKQRVRMISGLVQAKADPETLAERLRNRLLYGRHPYGAFATPESVKALTREDLVAFHAANFVPNNASLAIVGDVDPQAALASAREAFGDWEKKPLPSLETEAFPEIRGVSFHVIDRPVSVQSNVVVAGRGVARNNPDLRELGVVNSVLGGGFSGRLFGNLRERHGYTYGAYSSFDAEKFGGAFSATAEVRNEVTGAAVSEVFSELKRIVAEPIPEAELRLQRNYLAGNFLITLENNRRSAERLQAIDLYGLPEDYYATYAQHVMGVTPEEGLKLARQYIDPENLVVVVVGNAAEVRPQLEKLGPVTVYDTDLNPLANAGKGTDQESAARNRSSSPE